MRMGINPTPTLAEAVSVTLATPAPYKLIESNVISLRRSTLVFKCIQHPLHSEGLGEASFILWGCQAFDGLLGSPRQLRRKQQYDKISQERYDEWQGEHTGAVGYEGHEQETASADRCHHQQRRRTLGEVAKATQSQ